MPLAPELLLTWQGSLALERAVCPQYSGFFLLIYFFFQKTDIWAPPNGSGMSQPQAAVIQQTGTARERGAQTIPNSQSAQSKGAGRAGAAVAENAMLSCQVLKLKKPGKCYLQSAGQGTAE